VHHFSSPYVPHKRMISFFLIRSYGIISGEGMRPIELNSRYFLTVVWKTIYSTTVTIIFKCYSRQAFFPLTSKLLYVQYVVLEFSRHICWEYKHVNLCFGNYVC
jgi:hypothetical protein